MMRGLAASLICYVACRVESVVILRWNGALIVRFLLVVCDGWF